MGEYLNELREIMTLLQLNESMQEIIEQFAKDNKEDKLSELEYMDFFLLNQNAIARIREIYFSVKEHSDMSRIFFKILFSIGKQSVFNIIKPYEI